MQTARLGGSVKPVAMNGIRLEQLISANERTATKIPTMKTLGGVKSENGVKDKEVSTPNSEPEKISRLEASTTERSFCMDFPKVYCIAVLSAGENPSEGRSILIASPFGLFCCQNIFFRTGVSASARCAK